MAARAAYEQALYAMQRFQELCRVPGAEFPASSTAALNAFHDAVGALLQEAQRRIGERYSAAQAAGGVA